MFACIHKWCIIPTGLAVPQAWKLQVPGVLCDEAVDPQGGWAPEQGFRYGHPEAEQG